MTAFAAAAVLLAILLFPGGSIRSGEWEHPSKMTMGELYRYKERLKYHGLAHRVAVTEVIDGVRYFYKEKKGGRRIRCRFD